jgi:uncharacterized protein (TIRG00374 family)
VNAARLRRFAWIAIELAVTGGALALLFWQLDIAATREAFAEADYWLLAPAVLLLVADLQLRAVRWRLLLALRRPINHNNLFGSSNVGYLVNDILPFRAGEIARVLLIDELEKTGKVRTGASVVVERAIDAITMVLLLVALFPFIDEPSWATGPALVLGAVVVVALATLVVMERMNDAGRHPWKPLLRRVPRIGPRLEELSDTVLSGFAPLRRPVTLAGVVALTALLWFMAILSFWCVTEAFHLDVGIEGAALVLAATTLGMVVPSSPGYVGVFHAVAVETLVSVFGVPKESAVTYAVAQHGVIYFVPGFLGAVFLFTRRSVWHEFIASMRERISSSPPAAEGILVPAQGQDSEVVA